MSWFKNSSLRACSSCDQSAGSPHDVGADEFAPGIFSKVSSNCTIYDFGDAHSLPAGLLPFSSKNEQRLKANRN